MSAMARKGTTMRPMRPPAGPPRCKPPQNHMDMFVQELPVTLRNETGSRYKSSVTESTVFASTAAGLAALRNGSSTSAALNVSASACASAGMHSAVVRMLKYP